MSAIAEHKHDTQDKDGGYQKRCYCQKCKRTYDEWCKKKRECGETVCKRKCYTICEYKCERPRTIVEHWGWKREYEGKWEKHAHAKPPPKHCATCNKPSGDCSCRV